VVTRRDWYQQSKEHLVVLFLNTRYNIDLVSIGSLSETVAHPREILAPVLCASAYGFILMHNHPSGDPSPSERDRKAHLIPLRRQTLPRTQYSQSSCSLGLLKGIHSFLLF